MRTIGERRAADKVGLGMGVLSGGGGDRSPATQIQKNEKASSRSKLQDRRDSSLDQKA
jgi:hypothetical protein